MRIMRSILGATLLLSVICWLFARLQPSSIIAQDAGNAGLPTLPSADFQLFLPLTLGPPPARVLIAAAHVDSALSGEPDEAILLWNVGGLAASLANWQLHSGSQHVTFPPTSTLQLLAGQRMWCAARAAAFRSSFGESPACEWAADSDPATPNLEGKLTMPNGGGILRVIDAQGVLQDVLVYGDEDTPTPDWVGAAAQVYTRGDLSAVGQIWQRKIDPLSALPVDSNRASDWAGDLTDPLWGRRVRFPGWQGWDASNLAAPVQGAASAVITVAIGPEGLYLPLSGLLTQAAQTIDLSIYTLEHAELTTVLSQAAQRGVHVRVLLEGSPPGGISDLQKWCVTQIVNAGGEVRYTAVQQGAPSGLRVRYRFSHAKYGVIDNLWAINGTENFNYDSMPITTTAPVGGRRGFYLISDAPPLVQALNRIFTADWAPERFLDLQPYESTHPKYGAPPADFVAPPLPAYTLDESPFRTPVAVQGNLRSILQSSPENTLHPDVGLLALIARAGASDEIMLIQLYEHKNWGASESNPVADPNPRLRALVDAARRGAHVRLLLDSYFDEAESLRSNRATVDYLQGLAAAEGLALEARLGNPTLGGIHAKLVLLRVNGETWSAVGSLNGSETSYKLNRELVLLVDPPAIYSRLAEVFEHDWALAK